jgi:hypothetical protein
VLSICLIDLWQHLLAIDEFDPNIPVGWGIGLTIVIFILSIYEIWTNFADDALDFSLSIDLKVACKVLVDGASVASDRLSDETVWYFNFDNGFHSCQIEVISCELAFLDL